MPDFESCVGALVILKLKRPKVLSGAHVIVESEFMHRIMLKVFIGLGPRNLLFIHMENASDHFKKADIESKLYFCPRSRLT